MFFIITLFFSSYSTSLFISLSFLYFSRLFFIPIMISFYENNLRYFLGLITTSIDTTSSMKTTTAHNHQINNLPWQCNSSSISETGLGLVSATGDSNFRQKILESSSINPSPPCLFPQTKKRIGFLDDIGGGVDGLMSCTESLGFESSDERRVDIDIDIDGYKFNNDVDCEDKGSCLNVKPWMSKREKWRKMGERREVKKYPPPLSSLNPNGKPCFFLKPVRKDGRLELTEVKIHRPEILRAHREDGRLRLNFIRDDEDEDEDENEVEEDEENEQELEQEQEEEVIKTEQEEEHKVIEEKEKEAVEEEERLEKWRIGVNGEGFRRCHELLNHHHRHHQMISHGNHHHLPLWSQQCVTTM